MKFNEAVRLFGDRAWFDFEMVSLLSGEAAVCVHTTLYRWRESGRLIELRRGLFTLAEPWRHRPIDGAVLAQTLYPPSYLSGAWALRRYGLLPVDAEAERPEFDSVTARPAKVFENSFGRYSYATFPRDLLFGARTESIGGQPVRMALPEKALLDYWFIEGGEWDEARIESVGLNVGGSDGELLNRDRLEALAARAGRPRRSVRCTSREPSKNSA